MGNSIIKSTFNISNLSIQRLWYLKRVRNQSFRDTNGQLHPYAYMPWIKTKPFLIFLREFIYRTPIIVFVMAAQNGSPCQWSPEVGLNGTKKRVRKQEPALASK